MGSPSLSTSSSEEESESSSLSSESVRAGSGRVLGIGAGGGIFLFGWGWSVAETTDTVEARFLPLTSTRRVSAAEGGRNEGTGEFARLRACASLNAATEILWEASDAALSPLGRGRAGGRSASGSGDGESAPTWRKDLRLNEDEWSAEELDEIDGGVAKGRGGFDFVRSLAQENKPGDFLG